MQKGRVFLLAMVAFSMALGASTLANRLVGQQLGEDSGEAAKAMAQVVVAAGDIAYGQTLTEADLLLKHFPQADIQDSMFRQTADVVGKIATGELFKGEIILGQRLTAQKEGTILAALVDTHMRAVSVRVDDVIGVAGFLLPGNRVDVLASRMDNRRSETRTVLQNIRVLAVDQTAATKKDAPVVVRAVTLEVSPADSEALFQAMQEGSIHLTLRNPLDSAAVTETKDTVISEPAVSAPIAKPVAKKKTLVSARKKTGAKARSKAGSKTRTVSYTQTAQPVFEPVPMLSEAPAFAPVPARPAPVVVSAPPPVSITVIRGTTQQEMLLNR